MFVRPTMSDSRQGVLPKYGFGMDMIVSVHQLVSKAIILGNND